MAALLRCDRVSRFFGDHPVLRQVSCELHSGQLIALVGANGAGKSTLLRIFAGALKPTAGEVWLGDARAGSAAARAQTGFLSHQSLLHPSLTVDENLDFYATLFGLAHPRQAAQQALAQVHGEHLGPRRAGELSQGMRQKAALARCLLHRPRLLLLDEPFASLDAATVAELRARLAELRQAGLALLVSSHQAEALAGLTDGALCLERGRVVHPDADPVVLGGIR